MNVLWHIWYRRDNVGENKFTHQLHTDFVEVGHYRWRHHVGVVCHARVTFVLIDIIYMQMKIQENKTKSISSGLCMALNQLFIHALLPRCRATPRRCINKEKERSSYVTNRPILHTET